MNGNTAGISALSVRGTVAVGILEDDALLAGALYQVLDLHGYRVAPIATTAAAFLSAIRDDPPAVALVDLVLEGESGLDVVRELSSSLAGVRTITLSGRVGSQAARLSIEAGAWAYLDKSSADPRALLESIEGVLAGKKWEPAAVGDAAPGAVGETGQFLNRLTLREREVLKHIACGEDNLKISALLGITERTVKAHVSAIYRKLGAENRVELAFAGMPLKGF